MSPISGSQDFFGAGGSLVAKDLHDRVLIQELIALVAASTAGGVAVTVDGAIKLASAVGAPR